MIALARGHDEIHWWISTRTGSSIVGESADCAGPVIVETGEEGDSSDDEDEALTEETGPTSLEEIAIRRVGSGTGDPPSGEARRITAKARSDPLAGASGRPERRGRVAPIPPGG